MTVSRLPLALALCSILCDGSRGRPMTRVSMLAAPVRVKDTVKQLQGGLQAGLKAQCSRMHVQLPKASLGIEPQEKGAPVDPKKPDREAARAILEMFQALADTSVCVFNTELEAQLARNAWSVNEPGGLRVGDVVGLDIAGGSRAARRQAKKKGGKKGKGKGFKSLQALDEDSSPSNPLDSIPSTTEVLVVTAPSAATLEQVKTLDERFGMGTLIILLNPDMDVKASENAALGSFVESKFETAFYLQEAGDNLVYREFGKDWQLWSSEGMLGKQTLLHSQKDRFFPSEVPALEQKGLLKKEKGGFLGNLFG